MNRFEILSAETLTLTVGFDGPSYTEEPYSFTFYLRLSIEKDGLKAVGTSSPVKLRLNAINYQDAAEKARKVREGVMAYIHKDVDLIDTLSLFPTLVLEEALRIAPFPVS